MRIGELAQASGTPVETIRFYEREGLLPPPARADSIRLLSLVHTPITRASCRLTVT